MRALAPPAPDPVSDALLALSVRSSVFCVSELRAPWAFRVGDAGGPTFHLVLEGSCQLTLDGRAPTGITAGELVVLPRGQAHTIGDTAGSPAVALERLLADHPLDEHARLRYGGTGPLTRLLCGGFALSDGPSASGLDLMPSVLRVGAATVAAAAWLEPLLAMLDAEAAAARPGGTAIVAKIADVFLAQALRTWLADAERRGLRPAGLLRDRTIGQAVDAIRSRPTEPWTIARLAAHVGLARTALVRRFRAAVGQTPMRYLTAVRLGLAASYLAGGGLSISEVARLTGYDDLAAFSKAFKRLFGQPPGAYRRAARLQHRIDLS
jgi:AraC-like DNA-binding protein